MDRNCVLNGEIPAGKKELLAGHNSDGSTLLAGD